MTSNSTIPGSKRVAPKPTQDNLWSRRSFLSLAGWAAFGAVLTGGLLAFLRYLYPRVLFEPSQSFKAGKVSDYVVGEVSEKYKESQRVWIIREDKGIYALLAICTHLGCTPRWLKTDDKFKCPCHGSGFKRTGVNFEGPAPRPLERVKITRNAQDEIIIDKSKTFREDKGQWKDPDAFLKLA